MLSQQEISDRFEIQDLLYRYSELIDRKEFETLREEVFTDDAFIDYSVFGGSVGDLDTTIDFLTKALTDDLFPNTQHLVANLQVKVEGDTGTGRIMCLNPQRMKIGEDHRVWFCGLWYLDEYRRTDAGWRICRRVEEKSWVYNTPDFMNLD